MRSLVIIVSIAFLGACSGSALDKLPRLSTVNLADDPVSVALAEAIGDVDASLPDVAVVSEPTVETDAEPIVDPAAAPNFFARLLSGVATPKIDEAAAPVVPVEAEEISVVDASAEDVVAQPVAVDAAPLVPEPKQAGFFGRLFSGAPKTQSATPDVTPAAVVTDAPAPRAGLFAPRPRTGPDAQIVTVGTQIPFGEIATNCDVSRRQLGTKVGDVSGYKLYDTIPNATSLRTHYITGFKDRCARQFTAATSLMGDIGTHEVVRYLPSNNRMPYSATDTAYEKLKADFCNARDRQPCGRKLDSLAKSTTFITAYRNFGSNPTWSNILLHKGEVIEMGSAAR